MDLACDAEVIAFHDIFRRDASHHQWNYEENAGPDHWPKLYKQCGGSDQSPVNIDTKEADFSDKLDKFEFSEHYDDPLEGATIENNGHTIQIKPGPKDEPRTIDEGGMEDIYQFVQLHFHWGSDSKKGSEHTIDGKQYPLEMHLVHRNTNYKTMMQATQKQDGIAVLGVLFKVSEEDNPALEPIIDKLDDVRKEDSSAEMDDFSLTSLLPKNLMPYYRYDGSLTTPPCSEAVIWTVFKDFVPISEKQLQQFRNVKEEEEGEAEESLVNNFRPVQPLNGRVVHVSGEKDPNDATSVASPTALLLLSLLGFFL